MHVDMSMRLRAIDHLGDGHSLTLSTGRWLQRQIQLRPVPCFDIMLPD